LRLNRGTIVRAIIIVNNQIKIAALTTNKESHINKDTPQQKMVINLQYLINGLAINF
jgi:hypothetical protein